MRYVITFLTILLLALPVMGQSEVSAEDPVVPKAGYVGFAYDDHVSNFAIGGALNVFGDLWNFSGLLYNAEEQTASIEFAYLFDLNSITGLFGFLGEPLFKVPTVLQKLRFGPVAGPNARWEANPEANPTMRILGAAGAVAHYPLGKQLGVWTFWKYKFALDEESSFLDRNTFAAGISFNAF